MKCFIGLGSNLGDRRANLERAANALLQISDSSNILRFSPLYETPALVPEGAPQEWRQSFLNAVSEIEWRGSPLELLQKLKIIEKELGRTEAATWAPRIIDLDLLLFGSEMINVENLQVPHPGILKRSFVLDPLKDLNSGLCIPGTTIPASIQARALPTHNPWIMSILNLTPDSFSDGGTNINLHIVEEKIKHMDLLGVHAIDIGAESTRPGALGVSSEEEIKRLEPVLNFIESHYQNKKIRPYFSIDTNKAKVAKMALEYKIDAINDVGALTDPDMLDLLKNHSCDYILMHSLGVPADPQITLPIDCDPILEIKNWLFEKLEILESQKIDLRRIIFDPGIGFGKTAAQSITILQRIKEFTDLPIRLLVGHSRKSFLNNYHLSTEMNRDAATLAISLELARHGVDILRVHNYENHMAAFKVKKEIFL